MIVLSYLRMAIRMSSGMDRRALFTGMPMWLPQIHQNEINQFIEQYRFLEELEFNDAELSGAFNFLFQNPNFA